MNRSENFKKLTWDPQTFGEIDHKRVCAPYVRLSSRHIGPKGDMICVYDLRITQPNETYLQTKVLHSLEHLLLAGFRKHIAENFICVAPMGCQTGFYLVLMNEDYLEQIFKIYSDVLKDILIATEIPYVSQETCGQYLHHDLMETKKIVKSVLRQKANWSVILC